MIFDHYIFAILGCFKPSAKCNFQDFTQSNTSGAEISGRGTSVNISVVSVVDLRRTYKPPSG